MTRILDLLLRLAVEIVMLLAAPLTVTDEWHDRLHRALDQPRDDDGDDQAEQAM